MVTQHQVLVTSGPTRAYIDRIRYLANTSTGALGARIVEALVSCGIPVIHIYGTGSEQPKISGSPILESMEIVTVDDLIKSIKTLSGRGTISAIVHAMAVLDYSPKSRIESKKKSDDSCWDIHLVRTPKVISIMRDVIPDAYTIGFKLEVGISEDELIKRAYESLRRYRLDAVVANDLDKVNGNCHEAVIIGSDENIIALCGTKEEIARAITGYIIDHVYS